MIICTCVHSCPEKLKEGVRSCVARTTGSLEPPNVGAGNQLWSSARAANAITCWAIHSAPVLTIHPQDSAIQYCRFCYPLACYFLICISIWGWGSGSPTWLRWQSQSHLSWWKVSTRKILASSLQFQVILLGEIQGYILSSSLKPCLIKQVESPKTTRKAN